jgi:hypothetical protein
MHTPVYFLPARYLIFIVTIGGLPDCCRGSMRFSSDNQMRCPYGVVIP